MRPFLALILVFTLASSAISAVRGDKAEYVGGTVGAIPKGEQGVLSLDSKTELVFS